VLLPELRLGPKLVAQLRSLGILHLPAHQPRPVGEQRLVDDLDAVVRRFAFVLHLIGGEKAGVDEGV
jgi:hypothetical protein